MDSIAAILKLGELGLLGLVLWGSWKLAKPVVDSWLEQYRELLKFLLEMTTALTLLNAGMEELHADHQEITELLRNLNGKEK